MLLTNSPIFGIKVKGEETKFFTKKRQSDETNKNKQEYVESIFVELFEEIPVLKQFIETNFIDRSKLKSSLLFKPIGQNILFSVLKLGIDRNIKDKVIDFFIVNDFSMKNPNWRKIFYDEETGNIKTDKSLQKYAVQIISKKIGINIKLTQKDLNIHNNFNINL
jgi:hypothetical protein